MPQVGSVVVSGMRCDSSVDQVFLQRGGGGSCGSLDVVKTKEERRDQRLVLLIRDRK